MKIPKAARLEGSDIMSLWKKSAQQLSLETGIYIQVSAEYGETPATIYLAPGHIIPSTDFHLERIYFKIMDHEFESLNDLKKALNNKAFL